MKNGPSMVRTRLPEVRYACAALRVNVRVRVNATSELRFCCGTVAAASRHFTALFMGSLHIGRGHVFDFTSQLRRSAGPKASVSWKCHMTVMYPLSTEQLNYRGRLVVFSMEEHDPFASRRS